MPDEKDCPFYGYCHTPALNILIPQRGNQCGLITGKYSPCKMEYDGDPVSWENCPFNRDAKTSVAKASKFELFLSNCTIVPANGSGKMPLRQWFEEQTK